MKKLVLLFVVALTYGGANAVPSGPASKFVDASSVVVPLIYGNPSGSDLVSGMLYYNTDENTFNGIDNVGNKITFGGSTANAVTSTTPERIERFDVTTVCTSSPCTIASQSGAFTAVTHSAAGSYVATYDSATWSSAPTCVCTSYGGSSPKTWCSIAVAPSTSSVSFELLSNNTTANNSNFSMICMGPR
jgi:hypothetical protein